MKKLITLFALLALTIMGAQAQTHVTQTGQNFLTATSLTEGVAAATNSYLVSLQIHAGSTFYINNEGKAQSDFSTTGETTWIVEKTSDDKYLLRTFSGKYIKTLGGSNSTAATFTTNSSEALKFNPVQSESTDGNMESGYVANKAIWWNVDGGDKRINTNGISGTNKTIFQNDGDGCWTCLFTYKVTIQSGYNGYIGATKDITSAEWKTKGNWVYTDTWKGNGPGTTGSDMWSPIYLQDVTATGIAFEGWNLRLTLANSSLTATTTKFQGGQGVTINVDENSTFNLTFSTSNVNPNNHTFNIDGKFTLSMGTYNWNGGSNSNNTVNLGTTGEFTFTASSAKSIPATASFTINATLKDPTEYNKVESRTLATFTNVSVTTLSHNISGTDGWTLVANKDALATETTGEGKYYYVETSSTGITLYTYQKTYNVTYEVVDGNNNVLFTSDPVITNQGTAITTLPAEYQRPLFYTYNTISETADADKTVTFTATVKDDPLVRFTADTSAPEYYNLKIRDKFIIRQNDNSVRNQTESEPFNSAASWAFIGNPYAGFRVINKAAGTNYFLMYDEIRIARHSVECVTLRENDTRTWIIDTNNGGFVLRATENPDVYLHQRTNNGLSTCSVSEWSSVHNDDGSTIVATTDEDALIDLYNSMKDMIFGTGVGEYSTTYVGTDGAAADIVSIGAIISGRVTAQYPTAYSTLVDIKTLSTLNLPSAGFYRIKGKTSGNYLAAGMANNKFAMSAATDGTTVFYFDGYQLINLSSGMSNGMTSSKWDWVKGSEASTVTFSDGGTYGGYAIQSADAYFYDGGTNADRGSSLGSNERYRSWNLIEVTTLPVTISSAGYATLYAHVALTIPDDVDVYIASDEGEYLHLEEITGQTIPANTGVILAGNAGTYNFEITDAVVAIAGNALTGTVAAIARPENSYVLSGGTNGVGFYKDGATTIPGFKAYLPASAGARGFLGFNFDEVTAITAIEAAQNPDKAVYDLNGRRVENPSNGLYIVNGKKVLLH